MTKQLGSKNWIYNSLFSLLILLCWIDALRKLVDYTESLLPYLDFVKSGWERIALLARVYFLFSVPLFSRVVLETLIQHRVD